ncbi:MAG: hypothetical protein ABW128_17185 [Rhizorhabdus sp.]
MTDTVAFVQKWMMSGDHEPTQWDRDFAAAIDDREGVTQLDESAEAMICTGCGTTRSIAGIKQMSETAFSCCPERKMVAARDMWRVWCNVHDAATPTDATDGATGGGEAYRQGQIDMRERAAKVCDQRGAEEQEAFGLVRGTQNYFRARNAVRELEIATTPGGDLLEQAAREADEEGLRSDQSASWRVSAKTVAARIRALKAAGDGGEA